MPAPPLPKGCLAPGALWVGKGQWMRVPDFPGCRRCCGGNPFLPCCVLQDWGVRRGEIRKEADKSIAEHQWHVVPADCILDSSRRPSREPLLQSHLIHQTSDGTKLNVVQKLQTLISGPKSTHFSLLIFFLPNLADSSSIESCVTGPSFLGPLHLPRCSLDCCSLLPSSAFPVGFSSCQS